MSARVESPPIFGSLPVSIVFAVIVALGIGAAAGTLITKAVDDRPAAVATTAGAPLWDAQKLEAMAGRVLYQPVAIQPEVAMTAKPSITRPAPLIEGWDAYKLKAMEGRVLAAQVGAEDPPVKPHLPKRPPSG
jgi:hypothetical protein